MAITLTHIFEPTDANVLDPKKHRELANECPAMKLPGVIGFNIYRHTGKRIMFVDVELENYAALDTWEAWWSTPEGDEWRQKFWSTGKYIEKIILAKVE